MKLLPIGSVLCAKEKKAVVLGYHFETEDDRFVTSYLVVDFPMGYINSTCIGIVPVDAEMEVIFEGFRNDNFETFIKNKQELYELSKDMTVTRWNEELETIQQEIEINLTGEQK